jgi:hypothetical protein
MVDNGVLTLGSEILDRRKKRPGQQHPYTFPSLKESLPPLLPGKATQTPKNPKGPERRQIEQI